MYLWNFEERKIGRIFLIVLDSVITKFQINLYQILFIIKKHPLSPFKGRRKSFREHP